MSETNPPAPSLLDKTGALYRILRKSGMEHDEAVKLALSYYRHGGFSPPSQDTKPTPPTKNVPT